MAEEHKKLCAATLQIVNRREFKQGILNELKRQRDEKIKQFQSTTDNLLNTPFGPIDGSGDWSGFQDREKAIFELEKELAIK